MWVRHGPLWILQPAETFQFTHPCGCDVPRATVLPASSCFNSRTRVGATPVPVILLISGLVSIHAPVWVRPALDDSDIVCLWFQFTHPCGCDKLFDKIIKSDNLFQFTHPCGCDNAPKLVAQQETSFNSRTRVGATVSFNVFGSHNVVSIHAPVWVRRPDEYGLSIKHATKVLRQPDARTRCGQA